jgi:hypothetical protein
VILVLGLWTDQDKSLLQYREVVDWHGGLIQAHVYWTVSTQRGLHAS